MSATPTVPLRLITVADVRASIKRAKASLEKAAEEIVWQIEMEGWRTLGYSSWDAMREAEYGEAAFMVPRKQRPELVARMRAKGLTQQEIANTAGVSQRTISGDLNSNSANDPEAVATITNSRGQERPATYARTEPTPEPAGEFCHHCGADATGCTCQPPNATTDPEPSESVATTVTCPTCHGTGKVTR